MFIAIVRCLTEPPLEPSASFLICGSTALLLIGAGLEAVSNNANISLGKANFQIRVEFTPVRE